MEREIEGLRAENESLKRQIDRWGAVGKTQTQERAAKRSRIEYEK
jgi:hypothetical protein